MAAATPGITYATGSATVFYRITLPVPVAGFEERPGAWHAVLRIDDKYFRRYISMLDNSPDKIQQVLTHGLRYNLNVHTTASLRMRGRLIQDSNEPGAILTTRAVLTEYGLPVENRATVQAELKRPDTTTTPLSLDEVEPGVSEADTLASMAGIHRFQILATGRTLRNRPFTREQIVTGAVWPGGDDPFATVDDDPRERDARLCRLPECLLTHQGARRALEERGVDVEHVRRCVRSYCEAFADRPKRPGTSTRETQLDPVLGQILGQPQLLEALLQAGDRM